VFAPGLGLDARVRSSDPGRRVMLSLRWHPDAAAPHAGRLHPNG